MQKIEYFDKQLNILDAKIRETREELKHLAKGTITSYAAGNRKYLRGYVDGERRHLSVEKDHDLVIELLRRKYQEKSLNDITIERDMIGAAADILRGAELQLDKYMDECPDEIGILYSELPEMENEDLRIWMNADYPSNAPYPENRKRRLKNGVLVRSKSECVIGDCLIDNGIAFRYEWDQYFAGKMISTDYTLALWRNAQIKLKWWEHLGLDDPDYLREARWKINAFTDAGMLPYRDYILTFEEDGVPLDSVYVQKMIDVLCN